MSPPASADAAARVQLVIDVLARAVNRAVLLDDASLTPISYSRQLGVLDDVRTYSVLQRGTPAEIRAALAAMGIRTATEPFWTPAVPEKNMMPRFCVPVRSAAGCWAISSGGRGKSKSSTVSDMGCGPFGFLINKIGFPAGKPICRNWYPEPDSNWHTFRRRILNPLRLPIPPSGRMEGGLSPNHFFGSSGSVHGKVFANAPATSVAVLPSGFGGCRSRWASTARTSR